MAQMQDANISYDDIKKVLRNLIKHESLSSTSLDTIREELSKHFQMPRAFFDNHRDEVNQLILETLTNMYNTQTMKTELKAEDTSTVEKRNSTSSAPSSADPSPKRVKQLQSDMMTRSEFLTKAPKLKVQIEDTVFSIEPKKFSTDSCGWNGSERIKIEVDGKSFVCQVGLNCTVVGSKQWKP